MGIRPARVLAFVTLYGAMYFALAAVWGNGLSQWVINIATVKPAAWIARVLSGDGSILATGSHLQSSRGSINVLFGCDGTDVLMLLLAALLTAPASWRARVQGVCAGLMFVFAINQVRVVALFFAIEWRPEWFSALHGLIAPMLVVIAVAMFFFAWLHWAESQLSEKNGQPV